MLQRPAPQGLATLLSPHRAEELQCSTQLRASTAACCSPVPTEKRRRRRRALTAGHLAIEVLGRADACGMADARAGSVRGTGGEGG